MVFAADAVFDSVLAGAEAVLLSLFATEVVLEEAAELLFLLLPVLPPQPTSATDMVRAKTRDTNFFIIVLLSRD